MRVSLGQRAPKVAANSAALAANSTAYQALAIPPDASGHAPMYVLVGSRPIAFDPDASGYFNVSVDGTTEGPWFNPYQGPFLFNVMGMSTLYFKGEGLGASDWACYITPLENN